jgi:hypothetical protein
MVVFSAVRRGSPSRCVLASSRPPCREVSSCLKYVNHVAAQPIQFPNRHDVAPPNVIHQSRQAGTVIPSAGHSVGKCLRHSGLGECAVLLIEGLGDGGDAGIAEPLSYWVSVDVILVTR